MMLHSRIASFPPYFSFLNVRLVSLALLLVMSVLAGCATKPGLPDDPVLATGPGATAGQHIPKGPLRAITPI